MPSGKWIRPIPPGGGPILERHTILRRKYLAPLDVVELDLAKPKFLTRYQRENREVQDWNWRIIDRVEARTLLPYCSRSSTVLYNRAKVVEPSHLEPLDPAHWCSLQLVHVKNVSFIPDARKQNRWQAQFRFGRLNVDYLLSVTDPQVTGRLNNGNRISKDCLLSVSLTEPIELPQYELPELCYKLVAGVIEL